MNFKAASSRLDFQFEDLPDPGCVTEVADGIWWLALPLKSSLKAVNAFLLADTDGWALVDTGVNNSECRDLLTEVLNKQPFVAQPLKRVIATHFHPDHIGLAGSLVKDDVRFQCSETCFRASHSLWDDQPELPRAEQLEFMRYAGVSGMAYDALKRTRPKNYADSVARPPETHETLREGDVVSIGSREWKVVMGHGHCEEHVTLWSDDGIALVGDQILPSVSPNLSVHFTKPEDDTIGSWITSCDKFAKVAREDTLCLPGHGRPFKGAPSRCLQLRRNCEGVIQRLETYLRRPSTAIECLKTVYRRPLQNHERTLLIAETVGYLNHLLKTGRADRRLLSSGHYLWRIQN